MVIPAAPESAAATPAPVRAAAPQPHRPARSTVAAGDVPAEKPTHYVVCWGEVSQSRTAYFSAPFANQGSVADSRTNFRGYLMKSYGRVGVFNCRAVASLAQAQQQLQIWKDAAGARDKLVDTSWKPQ